MTRLLFILATLFLVACSDQSTAPTTEQSASAELASGTAITNVTVIDAVNGVRDNQTVVFDGDEIVAVQAAGAELNVASSIDGSGQYLIPGLWDFHVHLTYDDRLTAVMPEMFLSYGITSVRDTGGLMHEILPLV